LIYTKCKQRNELIVNYEIPPFDPSRYGGPP